MTLWLFWLSFLPYLHCLQKFLPSWLLEAPAKRHWLLAGLIFVITTIGLKEVFIKLIRRFLGLFIVTEVVDNATSCGLISYLERHSHRRIMFGERFYDSMISFVRPERKSRRIFFERLDGGSAFFFYKKAPIWLLSMKFGKRDTAFEVFFSYIRGTVDFEALLLASGDEEEEFREQKIKSTRRSRYRIYRAFGHGGKKEVAVVSIGGEQGQNQSIGGGPKNVDAEIGQMDAMRTLRWAPEDIGPPQSPSALELLSLDPELQNLIAEIRFWYTERHWHEERGVPWRFGILGYGAPGTGKSTFFRGVAEDLDLPVYVLDLASMSNADLTAAWQTMQQNTPCMCLIEDSDGVFHGRVNVVPPESSGGLSFDCLLNLIDGIERVDGLLFCMTTNHLEHIDPALGIPDGDKHRTTRPGRLDRAIEFKPLDSAGRTKVAERIIQDQAYIAKALVEGAGDTAAQFTDRCLQIARGLKFASRVKTDPNGKSHRNGVHPA